MDIVKDYFLRMVVQKDSLLIICFWLAGLYLPVLIVYPIILFNSSYFAAFIAQSFVTVIFYKFLKLNKDVVGYEYPLYIVSFYNISILLLLNAKLNYVK